MTLYSWRRLALLVSGGQKPGTSSVELPVTSFHVACSHLGLFWSFLVVFPFFYQMTFRSVKMRDLPEMSEKFAMVSVRMSPSFLPSPLLGQTAVGKAHLPDSVFPLTRRCGYSECCPRLKPSQEFLQSPVPT